MIPENIEKKHVFETLPRQNHTAMIPKKYSRLKSPYKAAGKY